MKFLIIAIDHGWQCIANGPEVPEIGDAKARYELLLEGVIAKQAVNLICEESDPARVSIAQKIANEHKPRIPWINIFMSEAERRDAGIWEALNNRPAHTTEDPPGSGYYRAIDHRIPEDEVREEFFAARSLQVAAATGAETVLVLCGDMHAEALRQRLEARKLHADTDHQLIPKQYWV